jgi:hypothetical protein
MIARMAGSNPKSNIRSASSKTWKPSCKTNVRYSSVKNVCRWYCTGISNCKTKALSSVWVGSKWGQELRMDTNQIRHLIQWANTFLHQVLKPSWCCNNNCLSIWVTRPTISVKHQIPFSKSQSWPWMDVRLSLPLAQRGNFINSSTVQVQDWNSAVWHYDSILTAPALSADLWGPFEVPPYIQAVFTPHPLPASSNTSAICKHQLEVQ